MKILIDGRMWGTKHTGIGRYVENLVRGLEKQDSENHYLVLLRSDDFNNLRFKDNFEKIEADFRHYSFAEQTKLPLLIKKLDFDIAHFPSFNHPILLNKPFVVTIHDMIMHKSIGKNATTLPTFLYGIKRFGYHKVFDNAVNKSMSIVTPSNFAKEDLLKRYKINDKKIKVISEGVDDLVKPSNSKKYTKFNNLERYFIYAGNAYPHKNIERLLEAFTYLVEENNFDINLIIVTKNNNFKVNLKKFVKLNNIKNVIFYSNLADDELGYLYANSLAFIYPSFEEGFGLQGLETVNNGSLIACSDIPIFKETYDKKAIYFNPHDFSSIQNTMFDIVNMKTAKRRELIKQQKQMLKKYSLKKMAKETLKIYTSII